MASLFRFSRKDLDTKIVEFFDGPGHTVEYFGLSEDEYTSLYELDNSLQDGAKPTIETLKSHGFHCFDYVKVLYAKANLFNSYHVQERYPDANEGLPPETVQTAMQWRYRKARASHPETSILAPPKEGNLVDYLSTFSIEQFVAVGW